MAAPTAAQCKLLNADLHVGGRADQVAEVTGDSAQNTISAILVNGGDSGLSVQHRASEYVSLINPTATDYPNAAIGSRCHVFVAADAATAAPTDYRLFVKTASGWERILTGGGATNGSGGAYPQYASANTSVLDLRGEHLAAGTGRMIYARYRAKTSNVSGDAVRAYAEALGVAATDVHGLHATAQVSAAGSIAGLMAGVRATAAVVTGLTLSGGNLMALRLDSDLSSAVTGLTACAYVGLYDVTATKMPFFLYIDASATGCKGATTAATAAGTLKVNDGGTTKYIQLWGAAS